MYHTVSIKSDGTLWAWGNNNRSPLGDGTTTQRTIPVQVKIDALTPFIDVVAVSAGSDYTVAIKKGGTIWAWGYNGVGQLGDGTTTQRNFPVQVKIDSSTPFVDVIAVSAGGNHTVALKSDGTIWAWGANDSGQLGDGTTTQRNFPVQIKIDALTPFIDVVAVSAGYSHTVTIKEDGTIWAWGANNFGQFGDGTTTQSQRPKQINSSSWKAASAGWMHTVAIKNDGTLWAWGRNNEGQLGNGGADSLIPVQIGTDTNWEAVSAGWEHTAAIKNDGTLWAWGDNTYGRLGSSTVTITPTPIRIGKDRWGEVSAGRYHTAAVKNDDTLYAWGYNNQGQLGDGTTNDRTRPTRVIHSAGD
ncbi:MAG: hypothetical protein FWF73_00520 [Spirochaetes bacterium]|nr:hypothetical protein [Spirochaetota bacterium]